MQQADDDKLDISKLNELYQKAETVDKDLFAEQRSNCLLISGRHYQKTGQRLWGRFREVGQDRESKLRLVKNHTYRIVRIYLNELLRQAPGVRPVPHNENELQDEKAAELANSVWQSAKAKHDLKSKIRTWASNFIDIGECHCKIIWDPTKGKLVGYEQATSEDGTPLFHHPETGAPVPEPGSINTMTGEVVNHEPMKDVSKPVFSGAFVFENVLAFNLLRAPRCESLEESPYLIVRKMTDVKTAKALCGGDEEKEKFVQESSKSTFKVFDGTRGEYTEAKDQVMLREFFFRPSVKYPNGWYCLTTEQGILFEDELPYGVFPIASGGFEEIPTSPRAHSIIRVLRPYQAEINRAASGIATAQVTLGDDKLIVKSGSKVQPGKDLPGVRVISVSGEPPTVMPGRSGEQYFAYLQAQISEMYQVANVAEIQQEINAQLDPNVLLFRSMRQKQKFSIYAEKFEAFLKDVCSIYLKLAQHYLPDDELIRAVGKREMVNIPEFKQITDMDYTIKLESVGEDIESMLGKSLQIQQILQYVGKDLPTEARGEIINAMPFLNEDQMFIDLTLDSKNADSDILSLDRGQMVPAKRGENHDYILKRLYSRQKMRDYDLLPDAVKQLYEQKIQQHLDAKSEELAKLKQLEMDFIPMKGALIGVDQFVTVPNAHGGVKTVRARVPSDAVAWLLDKLEQQGQAQQSLQGMPQGLQSDIADHANSQIMQLLGQQNPGMAGPIGAGQAMPPHMPGPA